MRCFPTTLIAVLAAAACCIAQAAERPNIVLVMADDMGWGQTGYRNHPVLKTPNLDAMAANGLRFDRFYAGGPVCSPTRASVLTGRSHDRCGVVTHGYALRRQEKTLSRALHDAGYATGHFGKWHLNGLQGPGVPILAEDDHKPGEFGFDEWVSVSNYFDRNPLMSHRGELVQKQGDSSEIIVAEALEFIAANRSSGKPFFTVIWYGSPHSPWSAEESDRAAFADLDPSSQHHYGELAAMDRSIGTLRDKLREWNLADNTLVWFCSDNGGLPRIEPDTVGGLRGYKGSLYEGGLRVPGIIEWPAGIAQPRVTSYPAGVVDIFPTLADIVGLPSEVMLEPRDGQSLQPLFTMELNRRGQPLPFRYGNGGALVGDRYKMVAPELPDGPFELYDLKNDPRESHDIAQENPEIAAKLRADLLAFHDSVEASVAGKDYPEGSVDPREPPSTPWRLAPRYQPFLEAWRSRPEYRSYIDADSSPRRKTK